MAVAISATVVGAVAVGAGIYESDKANALAAKGLSEQQWLDQQSLDLQKQNLDYTKKHDAEQLQFAKEQLDRNLAMSQQAIDLAKTEDTYKKGLVEKGLTNAQATGADYAETAQQAGADVTQNYNKAREAQLIDMSRVGLNPNSGKYATTDAALRAQEAADRAGAQTGARTHLRDLSKSLTAQAIQMGLGAPTNNQVQATEQAATVSDPRIGLQPTQTQAYTTAINNTNAMASQAGNMAAYYNQMGENALMSGLSAGGKLLGYGLSKMPTAPAMAGATGAGLPAPSNGWYDNTGAYNSNRLVGA